MLGMGRCFDDRLVRLGTAQITPGFVMELFQVIL
jgi:hypothetical protein